MIFNVKQIVSHLSQLFTLYPGDIISTGTPPGVGMGMKPNPIFLKDGDIMTLHVDGLGQQTQKLNSNNTNIRSDWELGLVRRLNHFPSQKTRTR